MRILAYQPIVKDSQSLQQRRIHVARLIQDLEQICHQKGAVDLILLPELVTIEYSMAAFEKLAILAEPRCGETFEEMRGLARRLDCAVAFGFPRVERERYFITHMVVNASGRILATYDKIHLAHFGKSIEKSYFTPGRSVGVFELGAWRFGLLICYDFRFLDLVKILAEEHCVDALLHPVAFTRDGSYESWIHFVICRALENQVYFLSVNRAGRDWGGSILCPPWIDRDIRPTIFGEEPRAQVVTLDKGELEATRSAYPFRLDKLQDYSALSTVGGSVRKESD